MKSLIGFLPLLPLLVGCGGGLSAKTDPSKNAPPKVVVAPATPVSLRVFADASSSRVNVAWAAVTGAASYSIEMRMDPFGRWMDLGTAPQHETPGFNVTGLRRGSQYTFRVKAKNEAGESACSEENPVSLPLVLGTPRPAIPTALTATAIAGGKVKLRWNYSASAPLAEGFVVVEYTSPTTYRMTYSVPGGVTEFDVPGLTPGVINTFAVFAYNAQCDSLPNGGTIGIGFSNQAIAVALGDNPNLSMQPFFSYLPLEAGNGQILSLAYSCSFVPQKPRVNSGAVMGLYHLWIRGDISGFALSSPEVNHWNNDLEANVTEAIHRMVTSDEAINRLISSTYTQYLGRPVDLPSRDHFRLLLQQQTNPTYKFQDFMIAIFGSTEYLNRNGNTKEGYIRAIYRDLLRRNASANDVAYHSNALGTLSDVALRKAWLANVVYDPTWKETFIQKKTEFHRLILEQEPGYTKDNVGDPQTNLLTVVEGFFASAAYRNLAKSKLDTFLTQVTGPCQ